jgi:HK97 family phage portal protein
MSVFKNFWDFVRGKMLGGSEVTISSDELAGLVDREKLTELSLYEFALCSGINIIANALSACEIRTFVNNKEIHGEEYYLWNYSPHYNYNANEFLQKIVWNLIYKNECLVVETRGGLVVADSYEHEVYALYQDVFRNVIVNSDSQNGIPHPYTFPQSFRMEDVLFYRLSSRNIKSILDYLMEGYRSLLETAIDKFQKSAGERGILTIDGNAAAGQNYGTKPDGTLRTFNDVFTEMMNERFKSYFNAKNAVMPIWKGFDYQIKGSEASKRSTSEVKDITDMTTEITTKVANALQIPPQLMLGTAAEVKQLTRNLITFGIRPIADVIETENNRKRSGREVLRGTYQMIDLTGIEYTDIFEAAQGAYNLLGSGASIDEIRVLTGRPELGTKWSRKHLISKNFADLETIEDLGKIGNGGTDPPAGNPEPGGDPPADGEKGAKENGGKEEENA